MISYATPIWDDLGVDDFQCAPFFKSIGHQQINVKNEGRTSFDRSHGKCILTPSCELQDVLRHATAARKAA